MTREVEEVGDGVVDRNEALKMAGRFEPLHDPFSSPGRWVRIFGPVVEALVLAMFEGHAHAAAGGTVGSELVGDQYPGSAGLVANELTQQAFCRSPVTAALNEGVEYEAILIDGTPKPVFLTLDGDHDFIKVPLVSQLRGASTQSGREFPAKLFGLAPDGLVTDDDPTNCEQILDHP